MFDQNTLAQLESNYQASRQAQPKTQPKTNNRKAWLSAIPSVLAAGASFIPGVGTAGAAALGGAGELGRQLLSGEKVNLGNVGKEAALSAVPGGLGKIGKFALKGIRGGTTVAKTVKAARNTEKAVQTGEDVAQATKTAKVAPVRDINSSTIPTPKVAPPATTVQPPPPTASPSMLSRVKSRLTTPTTPPTDTLLASAGQKIRASNRGIQAGDKIGKEVLDEKRAKELNDAISISTKGLTGRTVRGQVKSVQQAKQAAADELSAAAKASKGVVAPETKAKISKGVAADRDKILTFDPANKAHVDLNNRYAKRLDSASSAEDVLEARRVFGQAAQKVYANPDATQTLDKELAAVYYKHANKMLDDLAPEVRAADKKFSTLSDAEKALTSNKSKVSATGVKPLGTSINGRGVGGGTLQAVTDTAGKLLETAGSNKAVPKFARGLTSQVAGRIAATPITASAEVPAPTATDPNASLEGEVLPSGTEIPTTMPDTSQDSSAGISEALQAAMLQALAKGDYQGITAIKSVMDTFAAQRKNAEKPLSAEASKVISNAKTGLKAIDDFESLTAADPGAFARTNIPGVGVVDDLTGGRAGGALGTSSIDAAGDQIVDVIARLRTGAAISKQEETRFKRYIPRPGDPPETRQQKLDYLRYQFKMVADRSSGAENDTQQLLTQGAY